jgi:pyrroline-5-carboxylate reductase
MLFSKKIAFIGAGNMAEALIGGLIKAKLTNPENITATDLLQERLDLVSSKWGIQTNEDNRNTAKEADVIVLCVKPQGIKSVLEELREVISDNQLIISILAGITTQTINNALNSVNPVVRCMPNIPAVVDEGASAICLGRYANETHKEMAFQIFKAVGEVEIVYESQMDVITGLSGSGPAYIYMIIEALTDGGVMMGLPRPVATRLATQTVMGSAKLVRETQEHPAVLRDQVTTPGGTAITAIKELESSGLRPMLIRAVETATNRSKELSHMMEKETNGND